MYGRFFPYCALLYLKSPINRAIGSGDGGVNSRWNTGGFSEMRHLFFCPEVLRISPRHTQREMNAGPYLSCGTDSLRRSSAVQRACWAVGRNAVTLPGRLV